MCQVRPDRKYEDCKSEGRKSEGSKANVILAEAPAKPKVPARLMFRKAEAMSKSEAQTVIPLKIANAAKSQAHVFIRDLRLDAHIGVYATEEGRTQPIRINVDLTVSDTGIPAGDRLEDVVDYHQVAKDITAIVDSGHVRLVETLAEQVAAKCLEDPRVHVARVRIEKLAALAAASSVGVEIERARTD